MILFHGIFFILITTAVAFPKKGTELQNLGEGDIMMREKISQLGRRSGSLVEKNNFRWPGGIVPYAMNLAAYNAFDMYVISEALQEIQDNSCIRFIQRTTEEDFVYITPNEGCWSFIGHQGGMQVLSLTVPECISKGLVMHEFMHALGFWHEHNRPDRDNYIEILWDNVIKDKQDNFAKKNHDIANALNFPYDYQSVMHYDAYSFSILPRLATLKPIQPGIRIRDLGRAKTIGILTKTDISELTEMYECRSSFHL